MELPLQNNKSPALDPGVVLQLTNTYSGQTIKKQMRRMTGYVKSRMSEKSRAVKVWIIFIHSICMSKMDFWNVENNVFDCCVQM